MKQSIFQSQGFKGMSLLGDQLCLSMQEFSLQHCPLPTSRSFDLEFPTILNITTVLFLLFLKHLSLPSGSTSGCCQINVSLPGVVSVPFLCDFTCENDLQKGIYFALQFSSAFTPSVLLQSSAKSSNQLSNQYYQHAHLTKSHSFQLLPQTSLLFPPFLLKMQPNTELQRQEVLDHTLSFTPLSSSSVHPMFARWDVISILFSLFSLHYHHCSSDLVLNLR